MKLGGDFVPGPVLVEPVAQVRFKRVGDKVRPFVEGTEQNHVSPIASPVLTVIFVGEQLRDELLTLVVARIDQKRREFFRRGDIADDVEPHPPGEGGVVRARRQLGLRVEQFVGDSAVDPRGDFARFTGRRNLRC
jgi:hypothetical protein